MWPRYQLDSCVLKTTEASTLLQTEKGIVQISKDALAVPIKLGNQRRGYIFHGHGKLLIDTIIETHEGAVGKPIEKEIIEPFIMLGDIGETQQGFTTASKENLREVGYGNEQEFISKAKDLFDQFSENRRINERQCCGNWDGFVFAFPNSVGKFDILVARGSKLVYKTTNEVFVSNERRVVLKTPNEVIVSNDRKSVVIKR